MTNRRTDGQLKTSVSHKHLRDIKCCFTTVLSICLQSDCLYKDEHATIMTSTVTSVLLKVIIKAMVV